MVSPKTLRRKLQKKAKHRKYGTCPVCGDKTVRLYVSGATYVFKRCRDRNCYYREEMGWTGKPNRGGDGTKDPKTGQRK